MMSKITDEALRYTTRRQMSVARTFSRQHEVPRLPLPTLQATVEKYLKTVEPYAANSAELEATKMCAAEFLADPEVKRRHAALQKLKEDNPNGSWLERMWLEKGYLEWRAALPINSNVTGYLTGKHRKVWPQAWSAAALAVGAVNYHLALEEGIIPINMAKDKPQCMDQYSRMFALNRVPGIPGDKLVKHQNSKHVVAIAGRRLYKVQVLDKDDNVVPLDTLTRQIQDILDDARQRGDDPFPVAAMSGAERSTWAEARTKLSGLGQNAASLDAVESALFSITLDFKTDVSDASVASSTLVGDGRSIWFDKSFTVVVKGDGNPSIHIEHSWADAPVPLDMFFNHALPFAEAEFAKRSAAGAAAASASGRATNDPSWPKPQEIQFQLNDDIKKRIRDAEAFTDAALADSDLQVVSCLGVGKPVWKQAGLSPDAAVQMAFQLAWRRMHGGTLPVATYETIGMAGYLHGRTECCRVVSSHSEKFVANALNYLKTRNEKERVLAEAALREACDAHLKYIVEGQQGKGVDRHLLGLRLQSPDGSQPALFKDPLFARSGSTGGFYLSTSNNAYIPRPFGGMFGSGMPDGYGICYIPQNDAVVLCAESKRSCEATDSLRFCKMVNECLIDIATIAGVPLPKSML